jgi:hypothetical protein
MSTVVSEGIPWREALQKLETYPDLDVLTAGPASRRAADRLGTVLDALSGGGDEERAWTAGAFWTREAGSRDSRLEAPARSLKRSATGRRTESDWMVLTWVARN